MENVTHKQSHSDIKMWCEVFIFTVSVYVSYIRQVSGIGLNWKTLV